MEKEAILSDPAKGILLLKVKTGLGVFPVPGAAVTVSSEDGAHSGVEAVCYTDAAGITPPLQLDAVSADGQAPRFYTVEVDQEGYFTVIRYHVPVFPGITSQQSIYLTPMPDRTGVPGPTGLLQLQDYPGEGGEA